MNLIEALKLRKISYLGTRKNYNIHDNNPNILVLDPDYKNDSWLAFNFNYLDNLSSSEKRSLKARINKLDGKIVGDNKLKSFIKDKLNRGDYKKLSKSDKINRYKTLVKKFPELKKIIRRYKNSGINKET